MEAERIALRRGRTPGARNKRTIATLEFMDRVRERWPTYHPAEALIAMAHDPETPRELAKACHVEVLPYFAPKLRPVHADPDAVVEFEERIAKARAPTPAPTFRGIGDLLEQAEARMRAADELGPRRG